MFWEHTAASSMTLQPSQLPSSMQHFAATHNRCLQRIVWALPKILAFLLVAGRTTSVALRCACRFNGAVRQLPPLLMMY
jgi:hypothetical protein